MLESRVTGEQGDFITYMYGHLHISFDNDGGNGEVVFVRRVIKEKTEIVAEQFRSEFLISANLKDGDLRFPKGSHSLPCTRAKAPAHPRGKTSAMPRTPKHAWQKTPQNREA